MYLPPLPIVDSGTKVKGYVSMHGIPDMTMVTMVTVVTSGLWIIALSLSTFSLGFPMTPTSLYMTTMQTLDSTLLEEFGGCSRYIPNE